jgi:phage shock protein E
MTTDQMINLIPLVLIVAFFIGRKMKFNSVRKDISGLLKNGAIIVDVRSPEEFKGACNPKSVNIPVSDIATQANQLDKKRPIVVCCASGVRSATAARVLKQIGFENVINAGPWTNTL